MQLCVGWGEYAWAVQVASSCCLYLKATTCGLTCIRRCRLLGHTVSDRHQLVLGTGFLFSRSPAFKTHFGHVFPVAPVSM